MRILLAVPDACPCGWGPRRARETAVLIASFRRIMQELGWRPQYQDLRRIIEAA